MQMKDLPGVWKALGPLRVGCNIYGGQQQARRVLFMARPLFEEGGWRNPALASNRGCVWVMRVFGYFFSIGRIISILHNIRNHFMVRINLQF